MNEKKSYTFDEIKKKIVNYCVYQERSHQEVEEKMKEFLLIPEAKDEIFLYLIQENFLNEERFVRCYIRGKFYHKKWGKHKIKNHLLQKNIQEKLIEKCFDEIEIEDYQQTILELYEKYNQSLTEKNRFKKNNKISRFLIGKGYFYEDFSHLLEF